MSVCVSPSGEYGNHLDGQVCPRCHAWNADHFDVPKLQGLVLFEVYEASGNLLIVTSDASTIEHGEGDFIYRRAWSTSAQAEPWGPKHTPTAANCTMGGPGAWISSGLVCKACPPPRARCPIHEGATCSCEGDAS